MTRYSFNAHGIGPLSSDGVNLEEVTVKRPMRVRKHEWNRFAKEIIVLLDRMGKEGGKEEVKIKPFLKRGKAYNPHSKDCRYWLAYRSREDYLKGRIPTIARNTPQEAYHAHVGFIGGWTEI